MAGAGGMDIWHHVRPRASEAARHSNAKTYAPEMHGNFSTHHENFTVIGCPRWLMQVAAMSGQAEAGKVASRDKAIALAS